MSTMTQTLSVTGTQSLKTSKRVQLEVLIREFQQKLGNDWDKYHEALTMFLIGKLSRQEMVTIVGPLLKNGLIKYHNKFLLLNFANSLQDSPAEFSSELASFWNKKNAKLKNVKSTQYEKIKQNIMGLPLKERRRIRNITRESGKRNKLNAAITLTRQALLPKIPMIQDKEQQQLQVNNLVQWQQDVVNGINTPLALSLYELPDYDNLSRRVLMIMRENGLTGGVAAQVLEIISLGLESHLKNIIENAVDVVRYREKKYASNMFLQAGIQGKEGDLLDGLDSNGMFGRNSRKRQHEDVGDTPKRTVVLNIDDMYNTLEMFPHMVEPGGPRLRLSNVMLQDDDMVPENDWGYKLPPKPASLQEDASAAALPSVNGTIKEQIKTDKPENGDKTGTEEEKIGTEKNNAGLAPSKAPNAMQRDLSHIGTVDELKWVLHDLVSTM